MLDKIEIKQENYNKILELAKISNSINDLSIRLGWQNHPSKQKLKNLLLSNNFDINVFPKLSRESSIFNNEEKLGDAVRNSFSYTDVIKLFANKVAAGHYITLKKYIKKFNLDISHFSPYKNSNKKAFKKLSNEELFIINSSADTKTIRNRIIQEALLPYKCKCGNEGDWQNQKMTLQMDHKNGNKKDNRLANLEFLCPNCHSITPTYGSRNKVSNKRPIKVKKAEQAARFKNKLKIIKIKKIEDNKELILQNISQCNSLLDVLNLIKLKKTTKNYNGLNNFLNENKTPEVDAFLNRMDKKVEYPYLKKFKKLVEEKGYAKVAKELNCSATAVIKHMKKNTKKVVTYPDLPILKQMIAEKGYSQVARELNCSPKAITKHLLKHDKDYTQAEVKKVVYPDLPVLISMVAEKGFVQVGKELGCSDNAIRKHLKSKKIDISSIKNISSEVVAKR